jgi:hypothetical protein
MVIAAGGFPDQNLDDTYQSGLHGSFVSSSSGWGDGGYEVWALTDTSGTICGVEVVFLCTGPELASETILAESGLTLDEATAAAVYSGTATPAQRADFDGYQEVFQTVYNRLWNEAVLNTPPEQDATAVLDGELATAGTLGIGDPCYGGPSFTIAVPPGRYTAVRWMDHANPGHTARLALYRLPASESSDPSKGSPSTAQR